ncbi:PREDICTED: uncharacterized protein LOC109586526 isoform X1 [Amphimedon queenslandica]|uniref:Uncharacterized protein n=1 Tax=Amphimedon queenslandica TaxID=400682 RepID=A0AAN0JND0_AMPQE|nr:PREDICTED: uncharacterized protein LOC109586526 isoform X1 [Amphimedon queenslandica]|eukprot:XP_019858282.1 PREDICTED: uncharacterized protein LOC109586526 isoform X1 [Amphimedon queenslandica]
MHAARYIDKFPALVIYDQFVEEAQRVLKVENLRKVAFDRWTDVQPCILDLGKRERQKKSISDIFSTMDSEGICQNTTVIIVNFLEYNNILPMILLVYLVPSDSRQKVDHEAIISFIPASVDIKRTATSVHSPTPTLLCCLELKKSILVVDKTVVLELPIEESAIALLISYYNFNIGYPKGFHRYFMLLEMLLLDIKQAKVDRKVQTILSCLHKSSASIEP